MPMPSLQLSYAEAISLASHGELEFTTQPPIDQLAGAEDDYCLWDFNYAYDSATYMPSGEDVDHPCIRVKPEVHESQSSAPFVYVADTTSLFRIPVDLEPGRPYVALTLYRHDPLVDPSNMQAVLSKELSNVMLGYRETAICPHEMKFTKHLLDPSAVTDPCDVLSEWVPIALVFRPTSPINGQPAAPRYLYIRQSEGKAGITSFTRPVVLDARDVVLFLNGATPLMRQLQSPPPIIHLPTEDVRVHLVLASRYMRLMQQLRMCLKDDQNAVVLSTLAKPLKREVSRRPAALLRKRGDPRALGLTYERMPAHMRELRAWAAARGLEHVFVVDWELAGIGTHPPALRCFTDVTVVAYDAPEAMEVMRTCLATEADYREMQKYLTALRGLGAVAAEANVPYRVVYVGPSSEAQIENPAYWLVTSHGPEGFSDGGGALGYLVERMHSTTGRILAVASGMEEADPLDERRLESQLTDDQLSKWMAGRSGASDEGGHGSLVQTNLGKSLADDFANEARRLTRWTDLGPLTRTVRRVLSLLQGQHSGFLRRLILGYGRDPVPGTTIRGRRHPLIERSVRYARRALIDGQPAVVTDALDMLDTLCRPLGADKDKRPKNAKGWYMLYFYPEILPFITDALRAVQDVSDPMQRSCAAAALSLLFKLTCTKELEEVSDLQLQLEGGENILVDLHIQIMRMLHLGIASLSRGADDGDSQIVQMCTEMLQRLWRYPRACGLVSVSDVSVLVVTLSCAADSHPSMADVCCRALHRLLSELRGAAAPPSKVYRTLVTSDALMCALRRSLAPVVVAAATDMRSISVLVNDLLQWRVQLREDDLTHLRTLAPSRSPVPDADTGHEHQTMTVEVVEDAVPVDDPVSGLSEHVLQLYESDVVMRFHRPELDEGASAARKAIADTQALLDRLAESDALLVRRAKDLDASQQELRVTRTQKASLEEQLNEAHARLAGLEEHGRALQAQLVSYRQVGSTSGGQVLWGPTGAPGRAAYTIGTGQHDLDSLREEYDQYRRDNESVFETSERAEQVVGAIHKYNTFLMRHTPLGDDLLSLLELLGSDQYPSETHFLEELLQNVNDARFPGGVGHVTITLKDEGVVISSDERGLTPCNLVSLSAVGKSSKVGGLHTGQKGIGFKSCFRVCNEAIIKSRALQVAFGNAVGEPEPFELIMPRLTDIPCAFADTVSSDQNTYIILPFKPELGGRKALCDRLVEMLDATLLVGLRNIEAVTIRREGQPERRITRTEHVEHLGPSLAAKQGPTHGVKIGARRLVQLHVNEERTDMMLYEALVPVRERFKRREAYADGVTTVRIAFPVSEGRHSFRVFATLPVEDVGFPFLVDADFLVITNRSNVQPSVPWNVLLQQGLFEALELIFRHDRFFNRERLANSVPLPSSVGSSAWWADAVLKFKNRVTETGLLSASSGGQERVASEALQAVVPDSTLWSHISITLVPEGLYPEEIMDLMRLQRLSWRDLFALVEAAEQAPAGSRMAQWLDGMRDTEFARLFEYLAQLDSDERLQGREGSDTVSATDFKSCWKRRAIFRGWEDGSWVGLAAGSRGLMVGGSDEQLNGLLRLCGGMTIIRAAESPAEAKVYKTFFELLTATRGQVLSLVLTDLTATESRDMSEDKCWSLLRLLLHLVQAGAVDVEDPQVKSSLASVLVPAVYRDAALRRRSLMRRLHEVALPSVLGMPLRLGNETVAKLPSAHDERWASVAPIEFEWLMAKCGAALPPLQTAEYKCTLRASALRGYEHRALDILRVRRYQGVLEQWLPVGLRLETQRGPQEPSNTFLPYVVNAYNDVPVVEGLTPDSLRPGQPMMDLLCALGVQEAPTHEYFLRTTQDVVASESTDVLSGLATAYGISTDMALPSMKIRLVEALLHRLAAAPGAEDAARAFIAKAQGFLLPCDGGRHVVVDRFFAVAVRDEAMLPHEAQVALPVVAEALSGAVGSRGPHQCYMRYSGVLHALGAPGQLTVAHVVQAVDALLRPFADAVTPPPADHLYRALALYRCLDALLPQDRGAMSPEELSMLGSVLLLTDGGMPREANACVLPELDPRKTALMYVKGVSAGDVVHGDLLEYSRILAPCKRPRDLWAADEYFVKCGLLFKVATPVYCVQKLSSALSEQLSTEKVEVHIILSELAISHRRKTVPAYVVSTRHYVAAGWRGGKPSLEAISPHGDECEGWDDQTEGYDDDAAYGGDDDGHYDEEECCAGGEGEMKGLETASRERCEEEGESLRALIALRLVVSNRRQGLLIDVESAFCRLVQSAVADVLQRKLGMEADAARSRATAALQQALEAVPNGLAEREELKHSGRDIVPLWVRFDDIIVHHHLNEEADVRDLLRFPVMLMARDSPAAVAQQGGSAGGAGDRIVDQETMLEVGRQAEEFAHRWFTASEDFPCYDGYHAWVSSTRLKVLGEGGGRIKDDAGYDFEVRDRMGRELLIEVKGTRGEFDGRFFMYANERSTMEGSRDKYRVMVIDHLGQWPHDEAAQPRVRFYAVEDIHFLDEPTQYKATARGSGSTDPCALQASAAVVAGAGPRHDRQLPQASERWKAKAAARAVEPVEQTHAERSSIPTTWRRQLPDDAAQARGGGGRASPVQRGPRPNQRCAPCDHYSDCTRPSCWYTHPDELCACELRREGGHRGPTNRRNDKIMGRAEGRWR